MVIVYAVDNLEASASIVLDSLQPRLRDNQVVGLQVAPADLDEYVRISDNDFNRVHARKELARFLKDKYEYQFDVSEMCARKSPGAPIGAHFFYFAVFHALSPRVQVVGLGSEKKTKICNDHMDWINEYDKDDGLPPVESTERYTDYLLLAGPHFQEKLARRSREESCDVAVIGVGHAEAVSKKLEARLVKIVEIPQRVRDLNQSLLRVYEKRKHLLPDIND